MGPLSPHDLHQGGELKVSIPSQKFPPPLPLTLNKPLSTDPLQRGCPQCPAWSRGTACTAVVQLWNPAQPPPPGLAPEAGSRQSGAGQSCEREGAEAGSGLVGRNVGEAHAGHSSCSLEGGGGSSVPQREGDRKEHWSSWNRKHSTGIKAHALYVAQLGSI